MVESLTSNLESKPTQLPKQSVELIRATLEDMRKHGLTSGLPQEHAFTLLDEIGRLRADYKALSENCMRIQERAINKANECEARMFQSWKALRQQHKGMNRMARKIARLRERVTDLQQFHAWAEPQVHDHGRDVLEIQRLRAALRAALHPHSHECAYSKEWKRGVAPQCDCGIGALLSGDPSRVETSVRQPPKSIATVINNNQPGWTNIVETAPNVTLPVGTKLYDESALISVGCGVADEIWKRQSSVEPSEPRMPLEHYRTENGKLRKAMADLMHKCPRCRAEAKEALSAMTRKAHHPRCELMQPHGHEPPKCTCPSENGGEEHA